MFGRWPSSAASSDWWKPGAVRVRSKGEKYWIERFQLPAGRSSACAVRAPVPRTLPCVPGGFGADHGAGEERGATGVGEQDADLRRRAAGQRAGLGALEQDVAVRRGRAGALPEHVGGGGGDPPEVGRRLAVPGGTAGDDVFEAFQRAAREGVEVDRAVGVAGVERLLRVGRDLGVGELDQRHVRVGPQQVVGGVAVLPRVEHRLAVDDRQERLQLTPVPRRPHRRIPQHQQARVDRPSHKEPPPAPPSPPGPRRSALVGRWRGLGGACRCCSDESLSTSPARRNSVSSGRIATSIASGAAIISALAWE